MGEILDAGTITYRVLQLLSDPRRPLLIPRVSRPQADLIIVLPHVHHQAQHLLLILKAIPNAGKQSVHPDIVEIGVPLGGLQLDDPAAPDAVGVVFPLGLDSFFKNVVITSRH
eukprot:TRINITY_DN359_c0_g1_i2.p1 TRINITY_DN359_c0_g1~~TRINITY_DN359_c0_g1_i2.p1  ORF type:complete len:113 (-),score=7.39 TRINITY_DN359_c0_g1_i2:313-651(-)